jgi:hypothetical protein
MGDVEIMELLRNLRSDIVGCREKIDEYADRLKSIEAAQTERRYLLGIAIAIWPILVAIMPHILSKLEGVK